MASSSVHAVVRRQYRALQVSAYSLASLTHGLQAAAGRAGLGRRIDL